MKYYAVILHVKNDDIAKEYRQAHLDFIEEMCAAGHIHSSGRLLDAGGLIIYQGESIASVETIVKDDPYISHGARSYEIFEWQMKLAEEIIE